MLTPASRPTLRCVTEDFGHALPPIEQQLQDAIDHPLLEELLRLAPHAPTGQRRVLCIDRPMVYRVRHSRWRGATWLEEACRVLWLCAAEIREDGSDDDAYEHFARLHRAQRLLPEKRDYTRLAAERVARVIAAVTHEAPMLVKAAHARRGRDLPFVLADDVTGRLHASKCDELWVAVSRRPAGDERWLTDRLVMLIFAAFKVASGATAEEQRADWAAGDLAHHEVARFYL